jgi:hypothetical protein
MSWSVADGESGGFGNGIKRGVLWAGVWRDRWCGKSFVLREKGDSDASKFVDTVPRVMVAGGKHDKRVQGI